MARDDRLGVLGETVFAGVCERSKLFASKLIPDRTGKDFIVEWPPSDAPGLDSRPPPLKINAQVKATRLGSPGVKIKLSAAEWLVKDERPSFIVVPVFDDLECVVHYVVFHIEGELLERLLLRLRQASLGGAPAHKRWVGLTLNKGDRADEDGLRSFWEQAAGPNPAEYASRKSNALKTLGYEDEAAQYTLTFAVDDVSDVVACLMGERSLSAEIGRPVRKRFGIEAPESGETELPPKGVISVEPAMDEIWTFQVGALSDTQISMPAKSVVFKELPVEHWRAEATNGLVAYYLDRKRVSLKFHYHCLGDMAFELEDLRRSLRFWRALVENDGAFHVVRGDAPVLPLKLGHLDKTHYDWMGQALRLLDSVHELCTFCNFTPGPMIYDEIATRAAEILDAAGKIDRRQPKEPWEVLVAEPPNIEELIASTPTGTTLMMTTPVAIGDDVLALAIGYAVAPQRVENAFRLIASGRFPIAGEILDKENPIEAYNAFVSRCREEVGPRFHAYHELVDDTCT